MAVEAAVDSAVAVDSAAEAAERQSEEPEHDVAAVAGPVGPEAAVQVVGFAHLEEHCN